MTKLISNFTVEFIITLVVAFVLSALAALVLGFTFENLRYGAEGMAYANSLSGAVFGLIVGYKLSVLVRNRKK